MEKPKVLPLDSMPLHVIFADVRVHKQKFKYADLMKRFLEDASVELRKLSRELDIPYSSVRYFIVQKLSPFISKIVPLIHPERLGMKVYFFEFSVDPENKIGAIASLKENDLVRILWSTSGTSISALVVGYEDDIDEFFKRVKKTPWIKSVTKVERADLSKIDQPIPPSVLDRLKEGWKLGGGDSP